MPALFRIVIADSPLPFFSFRIDLVLLAVFSSIHAPLPSGVGLPSHTATQSACSASSRSGWQKVLPTVFGPYTVEISSISSSSCSASIRPSLLSYRHVYAFLTRFRSKGNRAQGKEAQVGAAAGQPARDDGRQERLRQREPRPTAGRNGLPEDQSHQVMLRSSSQVAPATFPTAGPNKLAQSCRKAKLLSLAVVVQRPGFLCRAFRRVCGSKRFVRRIAGPCVLVLILSACSCHGMWRGRPSLTSSWHADNEYLKDVLPPASIFIFCIFTFCIFIFCTFILCIFTLCIFIFCTFIFCIFTFWVSAMRRNVPRRCEPAFLRLFVVDPLRLSRSSSFGAALTPSVCLSLYLSLPDTLSIL